MQKFTLVKQLSLICEVVSPERLKVIFIGVGLVLYPPSDATFEFRVQCGGDTRIEGFPKVLPSDAIPVDPECVSNYILLIL